MTAHKFVETFSISPVHFHGKVIGVEHLIYDTAFVGITLTVFNDHMVIGASLSKTVTLDKFQVFKSPYGNRCKFEYLVRDYGNGADLKVRLGLGSCLLSFRLIEGVQ